MFDFITKAVSKIFGTKYDKDMKEIMPYVEKTKAEFEKLQSLSHDELRQKTNAFREKIHTYLSSELAEIEALKETAASTEMGEEEKSKLFERIDILEKERDKKLEEVLLEILPEAFAVVKETARRFKENKTISVTATELDRALAVQYGFITIDGNKAEYRNTWLAAGAEITWNMVHYDVQLIGGVALHTGKIAEMGTGEGKTLVATLPAYLNGLTGYGVHIVTVNDYLARRDSEWNGPIYNFLGLTCDCIDKYPPHSPQRQTAYGCDIVFGTNNEFGFDYLRDNMVRTPGELVQKKLHFAMVDEVDSVLIDDARTPLIIAGPVPKGDEQEFYNLKPRIQKLFETQKRTVQSFLNQAKKLIEEGKTGENDGGLALLRAHRGLPKYQPLIKYLSEPGIRQVLLKTENYYLQEQQKNMPKADGELYFVIEEKNNSVDLTEKGINLITESGEDPHFFVMPDVGSEIAEIEKNILDYQDKLEKKDRLMQDFAIKSERIHSVQQLLKAYTLFERDVEYVVVEGKVKIVDENTGRIMEGRRYSDGLHQAIEAKENVKVEAATQTFATITLQNYFRMYHKLAGMTGTAETEAGEFWEIYKLDVVVIPTNVPTQRKDMNDFVYKTRKEKFGAVIDEIVTLQQNGRPVLVGTTSVEVSELLSRMLNGRKIKHNVLNAKQHQREAEVVAEAGRAGAVTIATNMAGRGTDIKLGTGVKESGGLAIIGTERHESRRVDRQLRGRAGRQGDPGSSQFFVSLEDNLMRLFGSERIANLMDRMGHKEGEMIQHSMVTKSIERAQKKVEENNFGIRKRLLEYDDVMNSQRTVIYNRRKHALFGERLSLDLNDIFYDLCDELVSSYQQSGDLEGLKFQVIKLFLMEVPFSEKEFTNESSERLTEKLFNQVWETYKRKNEQISKTTFNIMQQLFRDRAGTIENVGLPITDGIKQMNVVVNLRSMLQSEGREVVKELEKTVMLGILDESWKEHLRHMDELKQSVQSAVYEQKDPLLIYKKEAFDLFRKTVSEMNSEIVSFLFKANLPAQKQEQIKEQRTPIRQDMSGLRTSREADMSQRSPEDAQAAPAKEKQEPVMVGEKIGRNDPCPCGSGKKYKQCHGKNEA